MANLTEYIVRVTDQGTAPLNRMSGASDRLSGSLRNTGERLGELTGGVPMLGSALGSLANPVTAAVAVVTALGAAYVDATRKSLAWAQGMAKVNVTAGLGKAELKGLGSQLREIGGRNASDLAGVPEAFNRIVSAGLDTNTALATLEPTLRAAKAGFTDVQTVAAAGMATMMAAGVDADKVYDVLFATMREGNAEFSDIANYLPRIVPLARNVGFSLDEAAGSYAALTQKLSAEQSATALQGIMRSLSDPKITAEMERMGIKVFDKGTGAVRPLLDIIQGIDQRMGGLSDQARAVQFDKLKLDQMGTLGFAVLTQDIEALEKAVDATVNSQGSLNKALEDGATPLDSWHILGNKVNVAMMKLGDYALPVIERVGQAILNVVDWFRKLHDESLLFREALSGIGFILEHVFTAGFFVVTKAYNMIKGLVGSVEWLAQKLGLAGLSFKAIGDFATDMYVRVKPYILYVYEMFSRIADIGGRIANLQWADAAKSIRDFSVPVLADLRQRVRLEAYGDPIKGVPMGQGPSNFGAKFTRTTPAAPPLKLEDDVKKAAQAGTRSHVVNINVGKFQDSINIYANTLPESQKDIQDAIEEGILRALSMAGGAPR